MGNRQRVGPRRERPNYLHASVGVCVAVVVFLVYSFLRCTPNEPTLISIIVFNFLFVFLIFPLRGSLLRKVLLLVSGNIVGLTWYLIQSSFQVASAYPLGGELFKIVYIAIGPIIDLTWIVSVWSLSLSALASAQRRNEGEKERGS